MDIKIRFAYEKDFNEVDSLLNEISQAIVDVGDKWSTYKVDSAKNKRLLIFKKLLNSQNKLFIASLDGHIVGCVNLQLIQNIRHGWLRGHIEEVIVKNEYRGKGIGSKLIQAVINFSKKNNIKIVKLMCGKQLIEAHKFYEKCGFKYLDKGYRLEID